MQTPAHLQAGVGIAALFGGGGGGAAAAAGLSRYAPNAPLPGPGGGWIPGTLHQPAGQFALSSQYTAVEAGRIYSTPIYIPAPCTINKLVASNYSSSQSGYKFRLGISKPSATGLPNGALIADFGEATTGATSAWYTLTGNAVIPAAGWYWGHFTANAALNMSVYTPSSGAYVPNGYLDDFGILSVANAGGITTAGMSVAGAYGALPANLPTPIDDGYGIAILYGV